jgi:hypothetical protein
LAEDPRCGCGFVAIGVLDAGVEERPLPAFVEDPMAVEHPPVVVEGSAGGVGDTAGFLFGPGSEVRGDARGHAVGTGEETGAAGVLGYGRLAGLGAGTG